jgi:hypothetical protein
MDDSRPSQAKRCAYTNKARTPGGNIKWLYCDRCGEPFYTNNHRSPLCGICLRASSTWARPTTSAELALAYRQSCMLQRRVIWEQS